MLRAHQGFRCHCCVLFSLIEGSGRCTGQVALRKSWALEDGSASTVACCQTWQPKFYLWNPLGKRELPHRSCPLTLKLVLECEFTLKVAYKGFYFPHLYNIPSNHQVFWEASSRHGFMIILLAYLLVSSMGEESQGSDNFSIAFYLGILLSHNICLQCVTWMCVNWN